MKHRHSSDLLGRRSPAAGFTLIEMLLVMGIAVILTTLTALAVRGINSTSSRHAAVGNLMGLLEQARMVAISDGRATYVVFASVARGQTSIQDTSVLNATLWGRGYALYEDPVLQDTSTKDNFVPVPRSTWLSLPTGVAFKSDSSGDNTPPSVTASVRDANDPTTFFVTSRATGTQTSVKLPYVKFDATGEVVDYNGNVVDATSPSLRVLLFEGTADSSSVEISTRRAAERSGADGKKYAIDEIVLKPTTGRAHYSLDPIQNFATPAFASNGSTP